MTNKKWIKVFITIIIIVLLPIILINFIIDPLWTFNHRNQFNNAQQGFNERQQKTNRAYFIGLEKYDTLLIGSSRSTYINQHDFDNMNVFNYASSNMYPYEYNKWINIAKKIKGKDFKTIIIGMDFFNSSDGIFYKKTKHRYKAPETYFEATQTSFYRYKQLLSATLFSKSIISIKHSFMPGTEDYSRDNVKSTRHISKNRKNKSCQEQLKGFSRDMYGDKYHYNIKIEHYFEELKRNNPNTKFIIYTTPVSEELFKLLISLGNFNDYQKWLKILVNNFDKVYHFMDINTITKNKKNYPDLHHFYPSVGKLIANKISKKKNDNIPEDFGVVLTQDNINQYFKNLKQQIEINEILERRNNAI